MDVPPVHPNDPVIIRTGVAAADAVLTSAKSRQLWDESSAEAYNKALQKLSGKEWDEAMSKLFTALNLNNGEIKMENAMNPLRMTPP